MRFYVDEMLGKMARWLRMSGWDVLYQRQVDDKELVETARREGRVILTRDTKLIKQLSKKEYLFISYDYLKEQLEEFYQRYPRLKGEEHPFSRCVECNTPIVPIEKEAVKDKVWPYVYQTQEKFTTCPTCHRVFWKATHVKRIKEKMELFGVW